MSSLNLEAMMSPGMLKDFLTNADPEAFDKLIEHAINQSIFGMTQAFGAIEKSGALYDLILSADPSIDKESFDKGLSAAATAIQGVINSIELSKEQLTSEISKIANDYANQSVN